MNFEHIKQKMDSENMDDHHIPKDIKHIESSKMPIQNVRKTMKGEIITQLICIVIFFAIPSLIKMHQLPEAIYYILMFVTCLITLGYLAKMTWFLKKSSHLTNNSKDTVVAFIYDLKLTLEVYKTAIISGSLLLPLSVGALFMGMHTSDKKTFTDIITLNISTTNIVLLIIAYVITALVIYFGTVIWTDKLYGVHIKKLESTLKHFQV